MFKYQPQKLILRSFFTLSTSAIVFFAAQLFAQSPPGRNQPAIAYDAAREQVVLFGGGDAESRALDDFWMWDGQNWTVLKSSGNQGR